MDPPQLTRNASHRDPEFSLPPAIAVKSLNEVLAKYAVSRPTDQASGCMVRAVRQLRKPTDFIVQKFPAIRYGLRHRRKIIEFSEHLEEERDAHHFDQQPFYPVDIGATLHSRYKVIGKVGYGMNGTVWLCRDTS